MGAGKNTLKRIVELVEAGHLPLRGAIVELGTQNVHCAGEPDRVGDFLQYFDRRGTLDRPLAGFSRSELLGIANDGYFGALLKAAGFRYLALDLFRAPDTRLFDLNLQFVPDELRGQFDLVTNLGTSEHLLNQMLCMRTIHDLAKPGGLIYHDLPLAGYHTHGYFKYNPVFFQDIAASNNYQVVARSIAAGEWQKTPPDLRDLGYGEPGYHNSGLEIIFRKVGDRAFGIPVEARTSGTNLDGAVWTSATSAGGVTVVPVSPVDMFETVSFWSLQAAYWRRLRRGIKRRLGFA